MSLLLCFYVFCVCELLLAIFSKGFSRKIFLSACYQYSLVMELLDLFDDKIEIAHKDEPAKEEKEEESAEYKTIEFWDIIKYAAVALGGGFVIHKLLSKQKEPDPNQMLMTMMFLIYQTNMQIMNSLQNRPAQIAAAIPPIGPASAVDESKILSEGNRDWIKFFEENKGKILDRDELMKIDELGVKENWRVERDMKGKVLNVFKLNEYLR